MPLHIPQAPAPALRSVLAALRSSTAVHGARTPAAVRAAHGTLHPELPLPVHEMTRVRRSDGPPRTRLTGWRFLLRPHGGEAAPAEPGGAGGHARACVGAAEAVLTADGWTFGAFGEGPYVTSTERALHQAEALSPGHPPYQPRLLSLPELYMLTLWLHHDPTADPAEGVPAPSDVLIPLAPAPPGIAAHQPRRLETLLPLLAHRLVPASTAQLGAPA
ncbi:hypothetical protein [Streptomyces sp. ODS28]|uniref:hypothetical protein n=1 Tax=Streptomyces sp. ODS28 TaxID=3136688 RepID=UPI0031EDEBEF